MSTPEPEPGSAVRDGRATIGDIAAQLGLSKAAVSYALNGRPGVGAATRERVLAAAEEMGWHPSSSARSLRGADAGVVGLVLSRRGSTAVAYLIWGGAVYLVLWVYGLVVDDEHQANFVPVNSADDWLHLVLGAGMVALGFWAMRQLRGGIGSQTPM